MKVKLEKNDTPHIYVSTLGNVAILNHLSVG